MKKLILGISLIILSIVLYISKNYFSKQETTNFDKDVVKEIEEKLKNEVYDT